MYQDQQEADNADFFAHKLKLRCRVRVSFRSGIRLTDPVRQSKGIMTLSGSLDNRFPKNTFSPRKTLAVSGFSIGFATLAVQIIILRELLAHFQGNELIIGGLLGCWLVWGGIGSIFVRWIGLQHPEKMLGGLFFLAGALTVPTILSIRFSPGFLQLFTGEITGLRPVFFFLFIFLAPFCFTAGAGFTVLSRAAQNIGLQETGPAWIYSREAVGGLFAALVHRFILAGRIFPFRSALIVVFVLWVTASVHCRGKTRFMLITTATLCLVLIFTGVPDRLDLEFESRLQPGFNLEAVRESPYGRIRILSRKEELSLFVNDGLIANTAVSQENQETIHLPLALHPDPGEVLLLEGGFDGTIPMIFSHPVKHLTIVMLDPTPVSLCTSPRFRTLLEGHRHPGLQFRFQDPRIFVKKAKTANYDVIISCVGEPISIAFSRFYTLEFYQQIKRILKPGGIFSCRFRSSENTMSNEQITYLSTALATLKAAFPSGDIAVMPGDSAEVFVSACKDTIHLDASRILDRLRKRNITADYISRAFLPFRLLPFKLELFRQEIQWNTSRINTDLSPKLLNDFLKLWRAQFASRHGKSAVFQSYTIFLAGLSVILIVLLAPGKRIATDRRLIVAVSAVGFCELATELILIFALQLASGAAYLKTGLLLGMFTFGLYIGSALVKKKKEISGRDPARLHLFLVAILAGTLLQFFFASWFSEVIIDCLALLCGVAGGGHFALASRLQPDSAGLLYGADLIGSASGAVSVAALLIPGYGIFLTACTLACVLIVTAISLYFMSER